VTFKEEDGIFSGIGIFGFFRLASNKIYPAITLSKEELFRHSKIVDFSHFS